MSSASLLAFLNRLDAEMQRDSEEYRTAVGNRKKTTLTHKNHKIRKAIQLILQLNNDEVKNKKGKVVKGSDNASISASALNKQISALTDSLRTLFISYAQGRDDVQYYKLRAGFSLVLEARGNKDGTFRSNYVAIQKQYADTLNAWYTSFLESIKRPEGLKRLSGNGKEVRTIKSGGAAFNLTHEEGSNVLHQMNDAVYGALEATYGEGSSIANIDSELKKHLDTKDYKTLLQITKNGKLGEVNVSISSALLNAQQGAGKLEQGFIDRLNKTLKDAIEKLDVPNLTGSDSLTGSHRKKLVKEMVKPFLNKKGIKVKHEDFKIKENTSPVEVTKTSKAAIVAMGAGRLSKKKQVRRASKRKPRAPRMALKNILGVLNAKLPEQVAKNMGSPRLENQTGRFAQSVRAIEVNQTSQGFPSIGYTYKRNPYGVYESTSGSRFAEADRDPRTLIDTSIREIVAQFGLGRLYTRRL